MLCDQQRRRSPGRFESQRDTAHSSAALRHANLPEGRAPTRFRSAGQRFAMRVISHHRAFVENKVMHMTLIIPAEPYDFPFDPAATALLIIDMQRDFVDSGGFGELLGNDVAPLREVIGPIGRVLAAWRAQGLLVIHTREGHRPDLSDCPPAKLARGKLAIGIGDQGPLGRVLVRGELGWQIIPELAPALGEIVIDKPGKGSFYATDLELILRRRGITHLVLT